MNQQVESAKKEKLVIIDWLIEHFPNAFFKKANQVKPLQIGIFDEIVDFYDRLDSPPFSKKSLREALSYYSSSPAYLNCQKPQTARIDLYGNEVDVVTEEQAKYAHQRYQQRYAEKKNQGLKQDNK
ncbi:protein convertase [Legionella taurinensis]|uniref:Protein convertase n=1 Tax=Legionella taurinensis TaxID=70611 RepID=A0A3A5L607_9GAMM|nr:ProQ/FinO family protein [Legionella taurinensis]MDX1836922.1 ProQ/FinO family protein [Legionella taurinensis]PUT41332.1 protein convertase [Legionella taurinensis]PUT42570.1 protein convertase [Legionella taurinensis]PUT46598.1 protein convertase [Legionella taurinensis]PUT47248.1 protein convertase [Legionella taurinensis]